MYKRVIIINTLRALYEGKDNISARVTLIQHLLPKLVGATGVSDTYDGRPLSPVG